MNAPCLFLQRLGVMDLKTDQPTMKSLLGEVAEYYGLPPSEFLSLSRKHEVTIPRQAFMWTVRQVKLKDGKPRYSLPQIARFLGGMDHTTVLHGVRQHQKRLNGELRGL